MCAGGDDFGISRGGWLQGKKLVQRGRPKCTPVNGNFLVEVLVNLPPT
jgi:hypothetical protein